MKQNDSSNTQDLSAEVLHRLGIAEPSNSQLALVGALLAHVSAQRNISYAPSLSERERACLFHLARGNSMAETAQLMHIKRSTVATYIKRIKQKLGSETIAQAVFDGMHFQGGKFCGDPPANN